MLTYACGMCERYVLPSQTAAEREFMPGAAWWSFASRYNVAPGQPVPAIRWFDGSSEAVMLRWGLIPEWAEGRAQQSRSRVAAGQLEESVTHREAWSRGRRCIVPASGFFAWQMTGARYRQPYYIRLTERSVFGFAALWDRSEGEDGDVIEGCSLVCVPPNELLAAVGDTDRSMPAILRRRDYARWLTGTPREAFGVLQSYPQHRMQAYPVSPRINSTAADDPGLLEPLA